jgi:hypothetical protein
MRLLALLILISVLAGPVFAYDVALKDGRVIHFQKYHVAESKLYFTDDGGREDSVRLESINLDLTRQLNRNANPPLELPGLAKDHENEGTAKEQSLGEVARQMRGNKTATPQRSFTNDDVQSATPEDRIQDWIRAGANPSSSDPAKWAKIRDKAIVLARVCQRLTEKEVASQALGKLDEVQFPGRDRWQGQLYAAHQQVWTLFETCVERMDAENQVACSKVDSAQAQLNSLKQEGAKRAASWKADREK